MQFPFVLLHVSRETTLMIDIKNLNILLTNSTDHLIVLKD